MALKAAKKISLNKYTHAVRASQAVLQYGVGAMVDFPNQTLMTAAPEYWQEQITQIHDERLEKVLHVSYFGLPAGQDDPRSTDGISYVRFPEWYFCPKCRKFQPIKSWIADFRKRAKQKQLDNDPNMIKHMQCPICRQDLVVTRIVTVCECGHIDDFPWVKWVHCQNMKGSKPICDHPSLTFKTSASSTEGLEGLTVACESCGARATLRGAFDPNKFQELDKKYNGRYEFGCTGRHPWKHTVETCGKYPKVMQRGSSSVYFPITASSLVIPPYSSILTRKIEDSSAFSRCKDQIAGYKRNTVITTQLLQMLIQNEIDTKSNEIALEIGISSDKIKPILERKWIVSDSNEEYSTASVTYRAEEYEALNGEVSIAVDEYDDFLRESTDIADYGIPYVNSISLIHKIREVQALTGFSRLKPVESVNAEENTGTAVCIKQNETDWYPAYEVRGEGIFIEFNDTEIKKWLDRNSVIQHRVDTINENYKKSFIGASRPRIVTGKFLLLHTISHLLIKQLSFECGYSIASLKERIYCSEESEGRKMAGILIYTASGDSEGTLGGLVRQGRADTFPGVFKKAIESAMTCSNDPVCSLSMGQGRDSLNLSACYSCCLIPETSCEEFNVFLDRGTVVGTCENRRLGFYYEQLYNGASWRDDSVRAIPLKQTENSLKQFILIDNGTDLSENSYGEIWRGLKEWSENETEVKLLTDLENQSDRFSQKEKPHQDCQFQVTGRNEVFKCDLFWKKSQVALFTTDNEECFECAKETQIKCFYAGDVRLTADSILNALEDR